MKGSRLRQKKRKEEWKGGRRGWLTGWITNRGGIREVYDRETRNVMEVDNIEEAIGGKVCLYVFWGRKRDDEMTNR